MTNLGLAVLIVTLFFTGLRLQAAEQFFGGLRIGEHVAYSEQQQQRYLSHLHFYTKKSSASRTSVPNFLSLCNQAGNHTAARITHHCSLSNAMHLPIL